MKKPEMTIEDKKLNSAISKAIKGFKPPDNLTVTEWAEKKRRLSTEASAEPGPWRTTRTPYLRDIMDAFSDPKIRRLVLVSSSQIGKTEMELNIVGYIIDEDPSSILFILPTTIDAKDFSKFRIAPMIRDCPSLRQKVVPASRRESGNTILQKSYPGGLLTLCGSQEAHSLASKPIRYVIGDERDRWATSAGNEGDPWKLAMARQITYYNSKAVEVSTPTIKNASAIERSYYEGTMERWKVACPHCGAYNDIRFSDIRFDHEETTVQSKKQYKINSIWYVCPACACVSTEEEIKKSDAKWMMENPDAYARGIRSFWLNSFVSPWASWESTIMEFLNAQGSASLMQVVKNTRFGELWENRGDIEDDESVMSRREIYQAELPEGVLVLTAGVDTQDDRFEYEIVGYGHFGETWGIEKGIILGRPDDDKVWEQLDERVFNRIFRFKGGIGLPVSISFVDEGGHFTQEVRQRCRERLHKKVFAIAGSNRHDAPYTSPPRKQKIVVRQQNGRRVVAGHCWRYDIGVDAGKQQIMDNLRVETPGPRFCHFPLRDDYGPDYFRGLLSERLEYHSELKQPWRWVKIEGRERNENLDCFDSETQVLTARGWRYFADVSMNDELATVNLESHMIEYQHPQGLISRKHCGEMVEIKGRRIDVLVTPKHRMVTFKKEQKTDPTTGKRKWNFDVMPQITLAKDLTIHHQLMMAADWEGCSDDIVIPASVSLQGRVIEPERTVCAEDVARFLGWYVSEGNRQLQISRTQGNRRYRVQITQNEGSGADKIRETLSAMPWKWREYHERSKCVKFLILSKQAYEFVGQCGDGHANKRVPECIKSSTQKVISAFLDAAIDGDGWVQRKAGQRTFRTYATTSRKLADDIQELFLKMGCSSNIKIKAAKPPAKEQYHITECHTRKASLDGGGNGKREYLGKTVQYDGMVYCATVPNGTLICRRNGKSFVAGNCRNYANAAFKTLPVDLDAIARRLAQARGDKVAEPATVTAPLPAPRKRAGTRKNKTVDRMLEEW